MGSLNLSPSKEDFLIIRKIARRTKKIFYLSNDEMMDVALYVVAVHLNGCPLKLEDLLKADEFNFCHDIAGISEHLNHETGKLENCFLPRFAKHEVVNKKIELWQPSNATDGDMFMTDYCYQCARDFRDIESCDINMRTMAFNITDPEYPSEWQYNSNGDPVCTAYVPSGESIPKPLDDRTIDLFEGK